MHDGMQYNKSSMTRYRVKVTSTSKSEIRPFSTTISQTPPPFKMGAGNLPLICKLGHNYLTFIGPNFWYSA